MTRAATKKSANQDNVAEISSAKKNEIADAVLAQMRENGVAAPDAKIQDVVVGGSKDMVALMRDPQMREAAVAAIQEARAIWDDAQPGWIVSRAWKAGPGGKGLVVLSTVGGITVLAVAIEGGCRLFGVTGPLTALASKLV